MTYRIVQSLLALEIVLWGVFACKTGEAAPPPKTTAPAMMVRCKTPLKVMSYKDALKHCQDKELKPEPYPSFKYGPPVQTAPAKKVTAKK